MADSCVVGVYESFSGAQAATHILHRANFPREQIVLIGSREEQSRHSVDDLSMGDDSLRDAAIGAGVGGTLGVLAGASLATLSGIAVVLVGGSVAGGLVGALVGALVGSLAGWGVHSSRIAHYERLLKAGKTLILAEGNAQEVAQAERILRETNPVELHVNSRDGSESPEILKPLSSKVSSSQ